MSTCIILNPVSGSGTDPSVLRAAAARLPGAEVRVTGAPGDASKLAAEAAAAGFETIVAAGGDGTVSEVVAGLAPGFPAVRVGLIPLGTGNDLARSYGIPRRVEPAIDLLRAGPERRLDVVRVAGARSGHFVNALVAGYGGTIDRRMDPVMKRRWGPLAYLRAAIGEVGALRPYRTHVELDGDEKIDLESVMVVVANGRFAGGRIPLAPAARPDDGLLDLMIMPALSGPRLAAEALRILLGRQAGSRRLLLRRARRVRLELDPPGECNVDGERCPGGPLSFEVLPGAIRIVAPPRRGGGSSGSRRVAAP
ncbi:MAG: diacylglycerol/lipid kinase family protein [Gemmatimonadota bacterium]